MIRLGIIGCGNMAGQHLDSFEKLKDVLHITVVCDLMAERAERTMEILGADPTSAPTAAPTTTTTTATTTTTTPTTTTTVAPTTTTTIAGTPTTTTTVAGKPSTSNITTIFGMDNALLETQEFYKSNNNFKQSNKYT